jgi:hypothetical protein
LWGDDTSAAATAPAATGTAPAGTTAPAGSAPGAATPGSAPAAAGAQAKTPAAASYPKELAWAVAEFDGPGDWRSRLPLLLVRAWEAVREHKLSDAERDALKTRFVEASLRSLDQQAAKLKLDLDRKRLLGSLPATEPAATEAALKALDDKRAGVGQGAAAEPPATLPYKAVWPSGQDKRPWTVTDPAALAAQAPALFTVTGSFRVVGGYLAVHVALYSDLESRVLQQWDGSFAPDEAADRMADASDRFRETLLGRPWAGLALTLDSTQPSGIRVKVGDEWHVVPWSTDDLEPGPLDLVVQRPGEPDSTRTVELAKDQRTVVPWSVEDQPTDKIVLETDPPGALLYMDSRYLGPSPQTVDRPRFTTRIRAQASGWETTAWEIGPRTDSPSLKKLELPHKPASVPDAKHAFYFSLAVFSFALTTTAFAGAWTSEQVQIADAYAAAGAQTGFNTAVSRYQLVEAGYVTSGVLTAGVFVWMMFALANYLGVTQATLP